MSEDPAKQFSGRRYINLESYESNGDPKLSPVQSIEHEGSLYFRTDPNSEKVQRIRVNPKVRIVPCGRSGEPAGVWVGSEARFLEGEDYVRASKYIKDESGLFGSLIVNLAAMAKGQKLTTIISIRLGP